MSWQQFGGNTGGYSFCWNDSSTKLYIGCNAGILRSLDSGNTWYNIYPVPLWPGSGIQTILMRNDTLYGNFYACSLKGIRYTADDGLTMTRIDSNINTSYDMASNATSLFVANYNYINYTHDNGLNWQIINTPHLTTGALSVSVDSNIICVGGGYGVHVSLDNGTTWTYHPVPGTGGIWSMCVSGNKIFAGSPAGLFKSVNYGNSWSQVISGQNIAAIKFFGKYGFLGTSSAGNIVYFSSDSGNSWTIANTNLPNVTIWDFTIIGNKIIAASVNGLWYTYLNTTVINEINNSGYEFNIYPNPAKDYFIINDNCKEQSNFTLFNSKGKEILKMIIAGNSETNKINTSIFSEGLYFWKIVDGDGVVHSGRLAIMR